MSVCDPIPGRLVGVIGDDDGSRLASRVEMLSELGAKSVINLAAVRHTGNLALHGGALGRFESGRSFADYRRLSSESVAEVTSDDVEPESRVDVVIAHDIPAGIPPLNDSAQLTPDDTIAHRTFMMAFLDAMPRVLFVQRPGVTLDAYIGFYGQRSFATRVIILDPTAKDEPHVATLDTETLGVLFFDEDGFRTPAPSDSQITDLTTQTAGRFRVTTVGSVHLFQLDEGHHLWERLPGSDAAFPWYHRRQPFRTLERCRIGRSGRWTTYSQDYPWHTSSTVRYIEPIEGGWPDDAL